MKKYIFITHSIKNVGGVQCYLAAKIKYLETHGWDVKVFFAALRPSDYKCPIAYLDKFLDGNILWMGIAPYKMPQFMVNKTIKRIISLIGQNDDCEEIIVETHDDTYSQWGEMISSRIGARHYTYLMNEYFRNVNQSYEAKIDFYKFKFKRHEILGGEESFNRLFEGYMTVRKDDYPGDVLVDECPVQDVPNEVVSSIERKDWNICYIGRSNKPYVPYIIKDVAKFSSRHKDKNIQFLVVSDPNFHNALISEIRKKYTNLNIIILGLLHPIPLELYLKTDVVVAGSGSARHSCEVGAVTIVADPETNKSNGILGYETMNSLYLDEDSVVSDFSEALERVFVRKIHLGMENKYPKYKGVEYYVNQNFELFSKSDREKVYYDETKLLEGKVNYRVMLTTWLANNFPKFAIRLTKMLGMDKSKIRQTVKKNEL